MEREGGIVIDFVGFHDTYYDAFTYVTKQDSHYVTSSDHVDLTIVHPKQVLQFIPSKLRNWLEEFNPIEKTVQTKTAQKL